MGACSGWPSPTWRARPTSLRLCARCDAGSIPPAMRGPPSAPLHHPRRVAQRPGLRDGATASRRRGRRRVAWSGLFNNVRVEATAAQPRLRSYLPRWPQPHRGAASCPRGEPPDRCGARSRIRRGGEPPRLFNYRAWQHPPTGGPAASASPRNAAPPRTLRTPTRGASPSTAPGGERGACDTSRMGAHGLEAFSRAGDDAV